MTYRSPKRCKNAPVGALSFGVKASGLDPLQVPMCGSATYFTPLLHMDSKRNSLVPVEAHLVVHVEKGNAKRKRKQWLSSDVSRSMHIRASASAHTSPPPELCTYEPRECHRSDTRINYIKSTCWAKGYGFF